VKSKKEKSEEVEYLKEEFSSATNLVVVQYKGLTVEQDTDLRHKIRESGSKYRVVKNRLAKISAKGTPAEQLEAAFTGPTAIAYNGGDPVSLAKALSDYAKANPIFEFKAGMVDGRAVEISTLAEIAALPSHEELLGKLMYVVNAPAQRIAVGINAVSRNMAVALGQAVEQQKFSE
jgi:large subunit ribosomal protein L10